MAATATGASCLEWTKAPAKGVGLGVPLEAPRSRVVRVQSPYVVRGQAVHRSLLVEMFDAAMTTLFPGAESPADAWRTLLRPEDIIGLKFNRSAQDILGTTPALAEVLVRSLSSAGWPPSQIVCIEAPRGTVAHLRTLPAVPGYSNQPVDFGSGSDQIAAVLRQITALIDVPYLKTHNIATVTCALKNLSHGLIKHPARYHANGCSPYIADIVASKPIRSRLRLCVVDALRVVFNGGAEGEAENISEEGILLVSVDPVATDAIGLVSLNETRHRLGLPSVAHSPANLGYLAAAHKRGLGIALPQGIDLVHVEP